MDLCSRLAFDRNWSIRLFEQHPGAISQIGAKPNGCREGTDYVANPRTLEPSNLRTLEQGTKQAPPPVKNPRPTRVERGFLKTKYILQKDRFE